MGQEWTFPRNPATGTDLFLLLVSGLDNTALRRVGHRGRLLGTESICPRNIFGGRAISNDSAQGRGIGRPLTTKERLLDEEAALKALITSPSYQALLALVKRAPRANKFDKLDDIFNENCSNRFLRYLLDPYEDHDLGLAGVHSLVALLPPSHANANKAGRSESAAVYAVFNWRTPSRPLACILVYGLSDRGGATFAVGLENKINAPEGFDQLKDYQAAIYKRFGRVLQVLMFASMDGAQALHRR